LESFHGRISRTIGIVKQVGEEAELSITERGSATYAWEEVVFEFLIVQPQVQQILARLYKA
jgi:hypothetical protein